MSYKDKDSTQWTEDDWNDYKNDKFDEIPEDIKEKGKIYLEKLFAGNEREIKNYMTWPMFHFRGGMAVRNLLRENVCLDDRLPDKNWDDYYIPLMEYALGLRK